MTQIQFRLGVEIEMYLPILPVGQHTVLTAAVICTATVASDGGETVELFIALWVKSGNRGNLKCLKVNDNFALIFHR